MEPEPDSPVARVLALLSGWRDREATTAVPQVDPSVLHGATQAFADRPPPHELLDGLAAGDPRAHAAAGEALAAMQAACHGGLAQVASWIAAGELQPALATGARIGRVASVAGWDSTECQALALGARALRHARDHDGAEALARDAVAIAARAGDARLVSLAHDELGLVLAAAGRHDRAVEAYARAHAAATGVARLAVAHNWADALLESGALHDAVAVYDDLVDEQRGAGVAARDRAATLDRRAQALGMLGHHDAALADVAAARALLDDAPAIDRSVNALAESALLVAAGRPAAEAFGRALEHGRAAAQARVDVAHYATGVRRAVAQAVPADSPVRHAVARAIADRAAGRLDDAVALLEAAARHAEAAGDLQLALRCRGNVVAVLLQLGRVTDAVTLARQVHPVARAAGHAAPELMAMHALHHERPGPDGELGMLLYAERLQQVHNDLVDDVAPAWLAPSLRLDDAGVGDNELALLARARGALDVAEEHARRALAHDDVPAEARIGRLSNLVALLVQRGHDVHDAQVAALLDQVDALLDEPIDDRTRALALRLRAEAARGTAPEDALRDLEAAAALVEGVLAGVPGAERVRVRRRFADVHGSLGLVHLAAGRTAAAFDALQQVKGSRVAELLPGVDAQDAPAVTCAGVQDSLRGTPDAVVDMHVTDERLVAFVVTADAVDAVAVPFSLSRCMPVVRADLDDRGRVALEIVRDEPALRRVAEEVVARTRDGARLTVLADNLLHNLPLHAIPVGAATLGTLRPLAHDVAAATMGAGATGWTTRRALVVGDSAGDLPGARAEVEHVAALLGTRALVGAQATREELRRRLVDDDPDIVHLAVHGRTDAFHGGRSAVQLADEHGRPDWVDFADLARLQWSARLVVLSGCSTGATGLSLDSQMVGVARAALEAGAGAVVGSLWPVEDRDAQVFMATFWEAITPLDAMTGTDLRDVVRDAARAVRAEHARAADQHGRRASRRRDGRPGRGAVAAPTAVDADAFVLVGDPVL